MNPKKLKPGLVASYDFRPGNGEGLSLFWFQHFINSLLNYLLWHLPTYLRPGNHTGPVVLKYTLLRWQFVRKENINIQHCIQKHESLHLRIYSKPSHEAPQHTVHKDTVSSWIWTNCICRVCARWLCSICWYRRLALDIISIIVRYIHG